MSGIAMYNAMMAMPYPIVTHNIGNVDPIANVVFLGGGERYVCPGSTFMFHGINYGQRKSAPRRECSKGAAKSSPSSDHRRISGIFATRTTNQRVSVASGMRLFKQQRTRSAQWATDKGFATGIQDFVLPAGAVVNFLI